MEHSEPHEETEAYFMTDSPDQLSMAEHTDDGQDGSDGLEEHENGSHRVYGPYRVNGKNEEVYKSDDEGSEEEQGVRVHKHEHHLGGSGDGASREDLSEEDDEEGEEDEEEDDDDEPALKYERLGGSVHDLLQKDSASALAHSHQRLVCSLLFSIAFANYFGVGSRYTCWHYSRT